MNGRKRSVVVAAAFAFDGQAKERCGGFNVAGGVHGVLFLGFWAAVAFVDTAAL